jgi:hypothetical protein
MGLEHKYLVHGVLSVALLHLARLHEGKKETENLNRLAAEQMNHAISHFRIELQNINENNAAALFAHSTLTAVYFFRTSALEMEELRAAIPIGIVGHPVEVIDKMVQAFMKTVWGLRGAFTVLLPGWNWVIGGLMSSVCTRKWWPKHRVPNNGRAKDEDKRLAKLEKIWEQPNEGEDSHAGCLSDALVFLRQTYALVSLLTDPEEDFPGMSTPVEYAVDDTTVGLLRDRAAIFVWATQVSKEYLSLVEQKNTEALVLLAHWAVLLGRVRNVWWMDGVGSNAIWAIAMALGPEQWHLVEWPTQAVGLTFKTASRSHLVGEDAKPAFV